MPLSIEVARLLTDPVQLFAHDLLERHGRAVLVDNEGQAWPPQMVPLMDRFEAKAERKRHETPQTYNIHGDDGASVPTAVLVPVSYHTEDAKRAERFAQVVTPLPAGQPAPGLYPAMTSYGNLQRLEAVGGPTLTDKGMYVQGEGWAYLDDWRKQDDSIEQLGDRFRARKANLMVLEGTGSDRLMATYPLSPREACIIAAAALGEPVGDGTQYMTYNRQVAVRALHILHEFGPEFGINIAPTIAVREEGFPVDLQRDSGNNINSRPGASSGQPVEHVDVTVAGDSDNPAVTLQQDRIGPYMSFRLSAGVVAAIEALKQTGDLPEIFAQTRENPPFCVNFNRYILQDVAQAAKYLENNRALKLKSAAEAEATGKPDPSKAFWGDHYYCPSEGAIQEARDRTLKLWAESQEDVVAVIAGGPRPAFERPPEAQRGRSTTIEGNSGTPTATPRIQPEERER